MMQPRDCRKDMAIYNIVLFWGDWRYSHQGHFQGNWKAHSNRCSMCNMTCLKVLLANVPVVFIEDNATFTWKRSMCITKQENKCFITIFILSKAICRFVKRIHLHKSVYRYVNIFHPPLSLLQDRETKLNLCFVFECHKVC